jgi:mitochondrial chaperone BCS1
MFMTTNHIDRLDPALIRPGRVDRKVLLDNASSFQVKEMFRKFYSEASQEDIEKFAAKVPDGKVSMAQLQGYLMIESLYCIGVNFFENLQIFYDA